MSKKLTARKAERKASRYAKGMGISLIHVARGLDPAFDWKGTFIPGQAGRDFAARVLSTPLPARTSHTQQLMQRMTKAG